MRKPHTAPAPTKPAPPAPTDVLAVTKRMMDRMDAQRRDREAAARSAVSARLITHAPSRNNYTGEPFW